MIIVAADWHIGFTNYVDYNSINNILDVVEHNKDQLDYFILNGDTVDLWRSKYSDIAKNPVFIRLQKIVTEVPTIYIRGNHDYLADSIIGSDLDVQYRRIFIHDNICYLHGDQFSFLQIESFFAIVTRKFRYLIDLVSRCVNTAPIHRSVPKSILKRVDQFTRSNFFEKVIISHYHCPMVFDNAIFTGDSINYPSYLVIRDESIQMHVA